MPGYLGPMLLSNLLAASAPSSANTNPAACAYTYTPDQALSDLNDYNDTNGKPKYKSVDDAIKAGEKISNQPKYIAPNGQDVSQFVKSPDDLLPMQKPGFWTRFANPSGAAQENAVNANYTMQPALAAQANRTARTIAASDIAKTRPYMATMPGQTPPEVQAIMQANDPSMAGALKTQREFELYNKGVPSAEASEALARAKANIPVLNNVGTQAIAEGEAGVPTRRANQAFIGTLADIFQNSRLVNNREGLDKLAQATVDNDLQRATQVTPVQNQLAASTATGELAAQPSVNADLLNKANIAKGISANELTGLPETINALSNERAIRSATSNRGPVMPAISSRITPQGLIPFERTPGVPLNMEQATALRMQRSNPTMAPTGGSTVTAPSGARYTVPAKLPVIQGQGEQGTRAKGPSEPEGDEKPIPGHDGYILSPSTGKVFYNGTYIGTASPTPK